MTRHTVKVVEGWLTLPEAVWRELQAAGWREGDLVEFEAVGDTVICTRLVPAASREPHPAGCLCDACTCGGCGERKHPGRCPRWKP